MNETKPTLPSMDDLQKYLKEQIERREMLQRRVDVFGPLVEESKREIAARDLIISRVKLKIADVVAKN